MSITKYLLLFYVIYLVGRVSHTLITNSFDSKVGSIENFNKLSPIKKGLIIVTGLPVYISIEIVPQTIASIIRYVIDNFKVFIEFIWENIICRLGKWVYETIKSILTFIWENILYPLGERLYKIIEFIWNDIIYPLGEWIYETIKLIWIKIITSLDTFWQLSKQCWYWIYLPVKEWVIKKLYQLHDIIIIIWNWLSEMALYTWTLWQEFNDILYEGWIYLANLKLF